MNVALALVALVPFAFAARSLQSAPPAPSAPEQRVDPTAIDAELLRALAERDGSTTATRTADVAPFPMVSIRGLVVPRDGAPVALLEIDGARVRVQSGTRLAFAAEDHLKVDVIRAGEIVLSRESTGETRVLR